jgi:hypothetical protein
VAECVICGRRGNGVYEWGVVMPRGTVARAELCREHSEPLRSIATKSVRERRQIGVAGLDELIDNEP